MVGPYFYLYLDKKTGKMVRRRGYSRYLHEIGDNRFTYYGKVKPVFKKGKSRFGHRWSQPTRMTISSLPRIRTPILECGYSKNQVWIGLCRAWLGFTVSKLKDNVSDMVYYARAIHKLQKQLGKKPTEFIGIVVDDDDDDDLELDKDMFNEGMTDEEFEEKLKLNDPIYSTEA